MSVRIVLADDHLVVRQALRALLERGGMHVVAEAADGWEAIRLTEQHRPDMAVLDFSMPRCSGLSAAEAIVSRCPNVATVILTMHTEEHCVRNALRVGVRAYVLKQQVGDELLGAIRCVSNGGVFLSANVSALIVDALLTTKETEADPLTPRERQLLQLVAEGLSTKESASLLGLSVKTTESYRARLMAKLDIHHTTGLVRCAIRQRLVEL
jgi:two-component system, NarL family, response regulator LiaR